MDNVTGIIIAIITAGFTFAAGRLTSKANANAVSIDTYQKQVTKIEDLITKVGGLTERLNKMERNQSALWSYVYILIDYIKDIGHTPPEPPSDLETDPKLIRLLQKASRK